MNAREGSERRNAQPLEPARPPAADDSTQITFGMRHAERQAMLPAEDTLGTILLRVFCADGHRSCSIDVRVRGTFLNDTKSHVLLVGAERQPILKFNHELVIDCPACPRGAHRWLVQPELVRAALREARSKVASDISAIGRRVPPAGETPAPLR